MSALYARTPCGAINFFLELLGLMVRLLLRRRSLCMEDYPMKETNRHNQEILPLSLARAALTDADWRFLRIVPLAGGYVMRRQAMQLGLRGGLTTTYERPQDRVRLEFLESVDLFANPYTP